MATIRNIGLIAQLRSEASSHVIRYRNGRVRQSGRGLVFWFRPETASISEVPMEDREMTLFVRGRSRDFQTVAVQGTIGWHVVDPELLASRVDFSIGLLTGTLQGEPVERIEARLSGIAAQAVLQYLGADPIGALLDAGPEPLRISLETVLASAPALAEIGVAAVSVRLTNLAPSSELERALQTPTFEGLQQKADEATFARRALAVEKERAIAENELATRTELATRETLLIAQEAANARDRAAGLAAAQGVDAEAEAERIRLIEDARAEAEQRRMAIYRDLPASVLLGLAARELAGKLETIEHVTVTPDLLAAALGEFRRIAPGIAAPGIAAPGSAAPVNPR
ncbi:SPFH domain-containing protein [Methylobacterium planeticum]|uniref:Band 7 protein n=1 Tax=Methylobacterium planeticum TaxID=2615211 RepID=A0A6N6MSS4_9HYPH|nr:SPFH domain-containing protein [Methylobacterium planeticum]KAB1073585.1 band 7 protein [Methylobacterium planeticum]